MLHENPLMADIDVDHWRNLQALFLESAKEKRRIILIHEDGRILKFVHSQRADIVKTVDRIHDPHGAAEEIYRANEGQVDFVAVFERTAFDSYFARFQDTWRADEDLDEYVHRTYALMDEYRDGIVTYPGPARATLGLQWRIGARYEDVKAVVERFVPPNSTVVLGVFNDTAVWAALVLSFDAERRINVVTTIDPSQLDLGGGRQDSVDEIVAWANSKYGPCSIALFTDLAGARELIESIDKKRALQALASRGALLTGAMPEELSELLSV